MSKVKEDVIIFKNELGKEVKITYGEKSTKGMKGAKNVPVDYKGVTVKMSSVDHNFEVVLTKKELDKMRFQATKFLKVVGKKSDVNT